MLKINENCIGCGACQAVDEEHFEMDGVSTVISQDNLDSEEEINCTYNSSLTEINSFLGYADFDSEIHYLFENHLAQF